jgi:hypothetical protein
VYRHLRSLLVLAVLGTGLLHQHQIVRAVTAPAINYPRIANIYSFSNLGQVPAYAHYGMVVASPAAASGNPSALTSLKSRNPGGRVLVYVGSDFVGISDFNGLTIYPGWWLTLAGTTLAAPLTAVATTVSVVNAASIAALLSSNPDVLVDGESMHVTAVNTSQNTLTVQRGYHSTTATHGAGARLAAHETPEGYGAWMLNVTAYCPHDPATGQTWDDYLSQHTLSLLAAAPWDGVYFDNANPDISYLSNGLGDADNDNTADGGNGLTGTAWHDGEAQLLSQTHNGAPNAIIDANGGYYPGLTDGTELEHFPFYNTNWIYGQTQYLQYAGPSAANPMTILNPDTTNTGTQNLQLMREGLATSLMGNGFFSYDYGTASHGQAWWYDEYDNGAGSSLASALTASGTTVSLAPGTGGRFTSGVIVFVPNTAGSALDAEQMLVTAVNGDTLTVQRGYNTTGTQTHAAGTKVVTQAQLDAGTGWLGQPLGPASQQSATSNDQLSNGGFETTGTGWLSPWSFSVTSPAAASISQDSNAAVGSAAARITVTQANPASTWAVLLSQGNLQVTAGHTYTLSFQAKADAARSIDLVIRQGVAPYTIHSNPRYGLSTTWQTYTLTFTAPATETEQVLFALAQTGGTVWLDDVHLVQGDPNLWRRDFTNGTVLLNETTSAQTISVGAGYRHILGSQNPALNDGVSVSSVTIPPADAVLLVRQGAVTPTNTPVITATNTATVPPSATATNTATVPPTATATASSSADQIIDGSFEAASTTPWQFLTVAPAAGTFVRDTTTAATGSASAGIAVSQLNASAGTWSVQLCQYNLQVAAGHAYTLSFQAKASAARPLDVVLKQGFSPATVRSSTRVAVGTTWQSYRVSFVAPSTESDALLFAFAQNTGKVWLDNVQFQ